MELQLGIKGRQETVVTENNVAVNVGSGTLQVFATAMMIALMEKAAVLSIEPYLIDEGKSSVGTQVNMSHCAPSPIGMKIWAETELVEIDRRRLVFKVAAYDECGLIGEGLHERFIIDIQKFIEKAAAKSK